MHRMSETDLHLPNLTIRRFRGIRDLSIERLGRVTLIAGKNGVGKTTLLDAVGVYASRGRFLMLANILSNREELKVSVDEDTSDLAPPDWDALFYGRQTASNCPIVIGPTGGSAGLSIGIAPRDEEDSNRWGRGFPDTVSGDEARMLRVVFDGKEQTTPLFVPRKHWGHYTIFGEADFQAGIQCESLGPNVLESNEIARFWDRVALTDDENRAVEALRLVFGETVKRAAVIGDDRKSVPRFGRRAVVRIAGQELPVPLRSLGDGAVRLFGVALALANSQGGFLLIDEAENGIHYSLQRDFWRMVLLTAQANNVQVFATTHSWDCMAGFAQAAVEAEGVEGALVRLESVGENVRAVEYSERQLQVAAEQGIEVR